MKLKLREDEKKKEKRLDGITSHILASLAQPDGNVS